MPKRKEENTRQVEGLKVCLLLENNALGEYRDMGLYGGAYKKEKADNCRIVTGSMIVAVVGKLDQGVN